jgi:hypothetical protein
MVKVTVKLVDEFGKINDLTDGETDVQLLPAVET